MMVSVESLGRIVRNILSNELVLQTGLFSKLHCKVLLHEENDTSSPVTEKHGYPCCPLYLEICRKLFQWMDNGEFPFKSEGCNFLTENDNIGGRTERLQNTLPFLKTLMMSWPEISDDVKHSEMTSILRLLGVRGLLDLIGIRQTQGSVDEFPPPRSALMTSFNKKHKPTTTLTVGARALSKHCHRDTTTGWWGSCAGNEQAKNEHADMIIKQILNNATWINIHMLPKDLKILEVRCVEGYGARWSHEGQEFRGFLEPQMVDGHAVGWRH